VLLGAWTAAVCRDRAVQVRWLLLQATAAIAWLPAVAIAVFRDVTHTGTPSVDDVLRTLRFLGAGGWEATPGAMALGLAMMAMLAWWFTWNRGRRLLLGVPLVVPFVAAAVLSVAFKPVWIDRVFVPLVPLLCLTLAEAMRDLWRTRPGMRSWGARVSVIVFIVAWATAGVASQISRDKGDGFRAAAAHLSRLVRPGDVVAADGDFTYWSFLWYFAGPDWGRVQQAYVSSPTWQQLMSGAPADLEARLGFGSDDSHLRVRGVDVFLWDRRHPQPVSTARTWLVRLRGTPPTIVAGRARTAAHIFDNIVVDEWAPSSPLTERSLRPEVITADQMPRRPAQTAGHGCPPLG
jgi:hypothetical protein